MNTKVYKEKEVEGNVFDFWKIQSVITECAASCFK